MPRRRFRLAQPGETGPFVLHGALFTFPKACPGRQRGVASSTRIPRDPCTDSRHAFERDLQVHARGFTRTACEGFWFDAATQQEFVDRNYCYQVQVKSQARLRAITSLYQGRIKDAGEYAGFRVSEGGGRVVSTGTRQVQLQGRRKR